MGEESVKKEKRREKEAKDEDDPEGKYRMFSILSYFFVLVVLGVPVWWYTTRVYRADLPLERMNGVVLENRPNREFGIPLSLEYDVLISFVHPDPEKIKIILDGREIEKQIKPFLNSISPVADFTVKSQWLYLTELGAIPRHVKDHYALLQNQLPHVITPLEKKLWSHVSPRPSLNLVVYFPQCSFPLYIYNSENQKVRTNTFISPRWGGIFILNPDSDACKNATFMPDMQPVVSTFVSVLYQLFKMKGTSETKLLTFKQRTAEDMLESTRRTLKSLAQLLSEISSIVISDKVANKINLAVQHADIAENLLKHNSIDDALEYARAAYKESEEAFSDPSLLALLYFPDDQKYAIYIPLFLPVMIPVIMSLISLRKRQNKVKVE